MHACSQEHCACFGLWLTTQLTRTGQGFLVTCMLHRIAGLHTVWWAQAFRGVAAVWGLGQDRQVPAVPEQPVRQL